MDYGSGTDFLFSEWKQIGDPKLKIGIFQGQEDGEFAGKIWLTPDWQPFSFNNSYTTSIDRNKLSKIPQGALPAIFYNEKAYLAEFSPEGNFIGYKYSEKDRLNINIIEKHTLTDNTEIYLHRAGDRCGADTYYVTTWGYIKDKKEHFSFSKNKDIRFGSTIPCKKVKNSFCNDFTIVTEGHLTEIQRYQKIVNSDLKEAITKIKTSRQKEVNPLGQYSHIVNSVVNKEPTPQLYKLEEKLHLLSYYTDVDVVVTFLQLDTNKSMEDYLVSDMAEKAIKNTQSDRKIFYIVIASSDYESIFKEGTISQKRCLAIGYAQSHKNIVLSKYTGNTIYDIILSLYTNIEKPLIINRFYQYADGSLQNYIYKSKKNQRGYPFIKHLEFYQSKNLKIITNCIYDSSFPEMYYECLEGIATRTKKTLQRETAPNGLGNSELWEKLSINDLGKFREVYMDYGQGGTPDYPLYLWQNSVDTWKWGNKVTIAWGKNTLPSDVFYNFDKLTLLDDAVYGSLDIFGLIPGVDTFTDPIGAVYAAARSDAENVAIYSASTIIPFAGATYLRGGARALSEVEQGVAIIAKKADNADGFELVYKKLDDIQPDEFYVASSIDGKQSQEFLEETQRYIDKNAVKKQVEELAKNSKKLTPTIKNWANNIKDHSLLKKIESLNADDLAKLEKDFLSSNGNELKKLITTADDLDIWKLLKDDPHYAFELGQEAPEWQKWAKSNFFKEVTKKGKEFENLVSSKIKSIPPFSTLFKDYTHLKQVYLKGQKETIIADDLFVKKVFDEVEEVDYFKAVISDSKLNANSPWTKNQKSELIDIFKNNPNKKFIEFEVRSDNDILLKQKAPKEFNKESVIRIYREDVYKIISDGENIKIPPTNMNSVNFK